MRTIARYETGGLGIIAPSAPGFRIAKHSVAESAGTETKVGIISLLPGGMTLDAGTGISRHLHASSPEPVIGFGAAKGRDAYYQVVRVFGFMPVIR